MLEAIAQFANAKYLNLETFRKTGVGIRTPVWFAQDSGASSQATSTPTLDAAAIFYIYSAPDAGKVKRIRNNPRVRVAPCDFRGNLRGAWLDAHARICDSAEAAHGQELLRQKYGWLKIAGDFFSRLRGRTQPVLAIHVD